MTDKDERWMQEALRAARAALEADEVPVGCVVVHEDRIIGRAAERIVELLRATP